MCCHCHNHVPLFCIQFSAHVCGDVPVPCVFFFFSFQLPAYISYSVRCCSGGCDLGELYGQLDADYIGLHAMYMHAGVLV